MPNILKKIFGRKTKKVSKLSKSKKGEHANKYCAELDTEKLKQIKLQQSLNSSYPFAPPSAPAPAPPPPPPPPPEIQTSIQNVRTSRKSKTHPQNNVPNSIDWISQPTSTKSTNIQKKKPVKHTIVDLDDSSFEDTDIEEETKHSQNHPSSTFPPLENHTTLNPQILQQHQQQMQFQSNHDVVGSGGGGGTIGKMQLHRLNNGKLVVMDPQHSSSNENWMGEGADSPTSTDFCLSTDLEDEGYNQLRDRGRNTDFFKTVTKTNTPAASRDSISPGSEKTEDHVLFPGIPNENSGDDDVLNIVPMANESDHDLSAWTPSPLKKFSKKTMEEEKGMEPVAFDFRDGDFQPFQNDSLNAFDDMNGFGSNMEDPFTSNAPQQLQQQQQDHYPDPDTSYPPKSTAMYEDSSDSEFEREEELPLNKPGRPADNDTRESTTGASTALFDQLSQASSSSPTKLPQSRKSQSSPSITQLDWPKPKHNSQATNEDASFPISEFVSTNINDKEKDTILPQASDITSPSNYSLQRVDSNDRMIVSPSPEHDRPSDTHSTHSSHYSKSSYPDSTSTPKSMENLRNRRRLTEKPISPLLTSNHHTNTLSTPTQTRTVKQQHHDDNESSSLPSEPDYPDPDTNNWLFQELQGTLGPAGATADLESLSGRSNRSNLSKSSSLGGKSHKSKSSHTRSSSHKKSRRSGGGGGGGNHSSPRKKKSSRGGGGRKSSSDSRSVQSRSSHRSNRSVLSHMSDASRSVAKDLMRLEMQLAMVEKEKQQQQSHQHQQPQQQLHAQQQQHQPHSGHLNGRTTNSGKHSKPRKERNYNSNHSVGGASSSVGSYGSHSNFAYTAKSITSHRSESSQSKKRSSKTSTRTSSSSSSRRNRMVVVAPPGKLGIILANKSDNRGTVVSSVRKFSVLRDRIVPGDRIVMIDGEDVSRMTVSEITTIMARKGEFERTLTISTTPGSGPSRGTSMIGPSSSSYHGNTGADGSSWNDGASSFTGSYGSSSFPYHG